jgi:hypothetical protein
MVLNFILFPIFVLLISVLGKVFQDFFNLKKNDYVFIDIIYGIFFLSVTALIFNFFLKLHSPIVLLFYLLVFLFGLKKFFIESLNNIKNKITFIILLSFLPSFMLAGYDSGLYHIPFQTWIQNEKIIIGLSNLNLRFGITSIFSYASALMWFENTFLFVSYFSTCFYLILFLFINEYLSKSYQKFIFGLTILISFPLWSRYIFPSHSLIDAKFGILVIILITILASNFKIWILEKKISKEDILFVGTLFFLIFTFKASGILFFPLLIFLVIHLIKIKKLSILITPLIFFCFLIIVWSIKSFLITGCFYYPVSISCVEVSWFSIENLNYINEQISTYAKSSFETINFYNVLFNNLSLLYILIIPLIIYLIINQLRYIKNFLKKNKLLIFLILLIIYIFQLIYLDDLRGFSLLLEQKNISGLKEIIFLEIRNIIIILSVTFLAPFIFLNHKLSTKDLLNNNFYPLFFVYIMCVLILWFLIAPQPRFAYGFIPLIIPLLFLSILKISNNQTNKLERKYLKLLTIFIVICFYFKIFDTKVNLIYDLHVLPKTPTEKRSTFGVTPKFQNLCWAEKNCYIFDDKNLFILSFFEYKLVE